MAAARLFSVSEIARQLGVTAQTIRNWADREGMPVAFTDPKTGARWFDWPKIDAWRQANKVGGEGPFSFGRGGRREGAGRKPRGRLGSGSRPAPPPAETSLAELLEPARPVWTLTGAMAQEQVSLDLPTDQRRKLATIGDDPTADLAAPIAAKTFQVQAQASLALAKQRQLTGRLVDREEAAAEWESTLAILARGLENLPRRVAPLVMPMLGAGAGADQRVRLEAIVKNAVDDLRVELVRAVESAPATPVRKTG